MLLCLATLLLNGCSTGNVRPDSGGSGHKYSLSNAKYHKVIKGDTLYAIAWKAGVDYKTLARWNGLSSPYVIYPGQTIRLKPSSTSKYKSKSKSKIKSRKSAKKTATTASKSSTSKASSSLLWEWPTQGQLLSSFKAGDSIRTGIKIGGNKGQKIYAAESGQVAYVGGGLIGYGQLIIIKHNNKYLSAYGHNSRLLVKEGQVVKKGKHIANMGSANSGKSMLHFEVRKFGKPVDPMALLPGK